MILGTKARYAVMAMVELAGRGSRSPVSLAHIAESQKIPLPYLEQIFARLRRGGMVKSVRGPGGGYVLAELPEHVFISAIVAAADEPMKMTRCDKHEVGGCMGGRARCATHDLWDGLERHIEEYLGGISLADVCARRLPHSACAAVVPNFLNA